MSGDPLAALRPLHAPAPISWWPPAPGWWLVLLLVLLLLAGARHLYRRGALQRAALRELRLLARSGAPPGLMVRELSLLLKRYALSRYPRHEVAGLTGQAWLDFLNHHYGGPTPLFASGAGTIFAEGPYRRAITADSAELCRLARLWITGSRVPRPGDKKSTS